MNERAPIPDLKLINTLDTCKDLTPSERKGVTLAMERYVERGSLPRKWRDWAMSVARAKNLFGSTEAKPSRAPRSLAPENPGDIFSTRPGPVDPRCLVLPKRPPGKKVA